MAKKPKRKEPEAQPDDLELEISDQELKDVNGGMGRRLRETKKGIRVGKRLSVRLDLRDNPIGSLRKGGRIKK